ncbi:uncharacterized protein LOC135503573 isoform X2 [Lineus longissimus]|uniref:uncharacterized protein LOC135503573 isoform X2 n=1 Tax=Lineus longissimus TaxID=88925 RepID=UPI00315DF3B3
MDYVSPIVDCSACSPDNIDFDPTSDECQKVSEELHRAFTDVGFAFIINHGISNKEMADMWKMSDDFFDLPKDIKQKALRAKGGGTMGWTPVEQEVVSGLEGDRADYKEDYNYIPHMVDFDGTRDNIPRLEWPEDDIPNFCQSHATFFKRLHKLSIHFLRLFGKALALQDADAIAKLHSKIGQPGNMTSLRFLKYPPIKEGVTSGQRLGAHKDFGTLTIMMQRDVGGLELQTRSGEWVYVEPREGIFTLIPSESFEFLTSGGYEGAVHRAGLPALHEKRRLHTRRSAAFFVNPDNHSLIAPLDGSDSIPGHLHQTYLFQKFKAMY